MDMDGLQAASLDGYDIEIRDRATLLPRKEAWVYGIVTGLTHVEIGTLYAESSVRDYCPEAVLVTRGDARQVPALGYLLPQVTGTGRNTAYALRLWEMATTLAFPTS